MLFLLFASISTDSTSFTLYYFDCRLQGLLMSLSNFDRLFSFCEAKCCMTVRHITMVGQLHVCIPTHCKVLENLLLLANLLHHCLVATACRKFISLVHIIPQCFYVAWNKDKNPALTCLIVAKTCRVIILQYEKTHACSCLPFST